MININNLQVAGKILYYKDVLSQFVGSLDKYNILLIRGSGSAGSNTTTIVDSSPSASAITNTSVGTGTFSPFSRLPGYWSSYFNGTTDRLTTNVLPPLGSGDFTIEWWQNSENVGSASRGVFQISSVTGGLASSSVGGITFVQGTNGTTTGTGLCHVGVQGTVVISVSDQVLRQGSWHHIAITRGNNSLRLFIDGIQRGVTASITSNLINGNFVLGGATSTGNLYKGWLSNFRIVRGTALYTNNFISPSKALSAITGTTMLACATRSHIDARSTVIDLSTTGSWPRISTFQPYDVTLESTNQSFYTESGRYLAVANSPAIHLTGDFTIEFWVYVTGLSVSTPATILSRWSSGSGQVYGYIITMNSSGFFTFAAYTFATVNIGTSLRPIILNAWHHISITRSENTWNYFVDGVPAGTFTNNVAINNGGANALHFGVNADGAVWPLNGYISNIRIVKNAAIYQSNSNFTPSTAPLTTISNTALLTCQSPTIVDNGLYSRALTVSGNTVVSSTNPFTAQTSYSVSFDGNGDYISVPRLDVSGDYTLECWANCSNVSANPVLMGDLQFGNFQWLRINSGKLYIWPENVSGTTTIANNTWYHFAVTRQGTTTRLFVNGVLEYSGTHALNTRSFTIIGALSSTTNMFAGFISNVRLINGKALYPADLAIPTQPPSAIENTTLLLNGSSAITDSTGSQNFISSATISTAQSVWNNGSVEINSAAKAITVLNGRGFDFGTSDFTIEFWYRSNTTTAVQMLYDSRPVNTNGAYMTIYRQTDKTIHVYANTAIRITSSETLDNVWYHIAVSRFAGNTKLFINGVQSGSTYVDSTDYINGANRPIIGLHGFTSNASPLNGFMQDIRVSRVARYTTDFTPPDLQF